MTYTYEDHIALPDGDDLTDYTFSDDLRRLFPTFESNHQIADELEKRGVIEPGTDDNEYSCTYVYFKTEDAARAFLDRLNQQPEIRGDDKPVSKITYVIEEDEWNRLKMFLKATLTADQYTALQALDIKIDERRVWRSSQDYIAAQLQATTDGK